MFDAIVDEGEWDKEWKSSSGCFELKAGETLPIEINGDVSIRHF